jgi:hypothetical protein
MAETTTTYESDKYITFSGDDSEWREWSTKVKATGQKKGWLKSLETQIVLLPDSTEEAEVLKVKKNADALYFLTMSCKETAFSYVEMVDGSAHTAWTNLLTRYQDVDEDDLTKLHTAFSECVMESHLQDPAIWFREMDLCKRKIVTAGGQPKSDAEMIANIISQAPIEYKMAKMSITTNKIRVLADVKKIYNDFWSSEYKAETSALKKGGEAYWTDNKDGKTRGKPWKRFKGTCNNCGKQGHKKADCRLPAKSSGGNDGNNGGGGDRSGPDTRVCHRCKKVGHIARNCPQKQDAADALFVGNVEIDKVPNDTCAWATMGHFAKNCSQKQDATVPNDTWDMAAMEAQDKTNKVECTGMTEMFIETRLFATGGYPLSVYKKGRVMPEGVDSNPLIQKTWWANARDGQDKESEHSRIMNMKDPINGERFNISGVKMDCISSLWLDDEEEEAVAMMLGFWKFENSSTSESPHDVFTTRRDDTEDDTENESPTEKWLMDSGATVHVTNSKKYLLNPSEETVRVGNGEESKASLSGKVTLKSEQGSGQLALKKVLYIEGFAKNILSIPLLLENGASIEWKENRLSITNSAGTSTIHIDKEGSEVMFYFKGRRIENEAMVSEKNVKMDINEAHEKGVHVHEACLRKTFLKMRVDLVGDLLPCDGCMKAKARAKAVPKLTSLKATMAGERFYLDTTGPFKLSMSGSKFDVKLVDQFSRKTWGVRVKRKAEIPNLVELHFDSLKAMKKDVKFLRADNAGEHGIKLANVCNKFGVTLELTAPNTPQQNGVVERKIYTDKNRAHAMLISARLTPEAQDLLRAEAVATAELISNMLAGPDGISPNMRWNGEPGKLKAKDLVEFGRIGYVTDRTKFKAKMAEKATKCIMVGYATNHSSDTYRVYDPLTKKVRLSRDVKWAEWKRTDPSETMKIFSKEHKNGSPAGISEEDSDDERPTPPDIVPMDEDEDTASSRVHETERNERDLEQQRSKKLARELARLDWNVKPPARNMIEDDDAEEEAKDGEENDVQFVFSTSLSSDPGEPKTLKEALEGIDSKLWTASVSGEIMNFLKRDAWKKVPMKQVLAEGRKPTPTKIIFKVKSEQNGTKKCKTRIVTKGFMQIPGVDFTESFSPVATDASIRITFGISLYFMEDGDADGEWVLEIFDVEAAFLNAELAKKMYIEIPEAMVKLGFVTEQERKDFAIELGKSMYGNVDAALLFFRTFKSIVVGKLGLKQSLTDPCVFYGVNAKGVLDIIVSTHVDDSAVGGRKTRVQKFLSDFEQHLKIERLGPMKKHLGVWWKLLRDEKRELYLEGSMDAMAGEIINSFKECKGYAAKNADTPAFPGTALKKATEEDEIIMLDEYRSLVGKLLYFVTKLQPQMSNAVRELSSHMSKPTKAHWKAAERCVGYLTKNRKDAKIILRKPKELRSVSWCDSDHAKNEDNRKSISGRVSTLGGMITSWSSKAQTTVTLSSTESEYASYSVCCQEAMFTNMLLRELFGVVEHARIFEDNIGAIFLIKNQQVGPRTKHIDIRHHFVREQYSRNEVLPEYVNTEFNYSDIMTKNLGDKLFKKFGQSICLGGIVYDVYNVEERMSKHEVNETSVVNQTDETTHDWTLVVRHRKPVKRPQRRGSSSKNRGRSRYHGSAIDRLSKKSMLVAKERNVPRIRRPEPSNDSKHERIAIEIAMDFCEKPSQTVEESTEVEAVPGAAAGIVDDGRRSSSEMNRFTIE